MIKVFDVPGFMKVFLSTDPCKDNENSLTTQCRVESITRQSIFSPLPESCPPGGEPLCASDGHTYPSECAMEATGRRKGIKVKKIHNGKCRREGKGSLFESQLGCFNLELFRILLHHKARLLWS